MKVRATLARARCLPAWSWLLLLFQCFLLNGSLAQNYPTQPIRLIVPFGPGSGSDIVARRLAIFLQDRLGQSVVVDNRPGAQGMIGTEMLKNAAPDGLTLGISTNSTHAAAQYLFRKLPYDALNDFEHIALIGVGGSVALVPVDSPFKSMQELASYAKSHPGQVFFGHADTSSQIPGTLLRTLWKIPVEGVPYKASANIVTDLIGGQIQVAFFNYMTGAAQTAGGRLIPIAITEPRRNAHWPGVPTVAETFPGYEVGFFVGVSAPRGVPPQVLARLQRILTQAQDDPAVREPLERTGMIFQRQPPGGYRAYIGSQAQRWRELISQAGISPQ